MRSELAFTLVSRPELVVFDCDGVLVNSETLMHEELHLELLERGVQITLEQCLTNLVGKSIEDVIHTAIELGAILPDNWKSVLYERVFARLNQGVDVIPGVPELVQRLTDEHIPFCVVSNGSEEKMELMLSQHGLWEAFKDNCFSAHTIGIAKPDPGLLHHALSKMNTQPASAVIIEDSPIGIQSAANASVPCLVFAPNGCAINLDKSAALGFESMSDIADFIFSLTATEQA